MTFNHALPLQDACNLPSTSHGKNGKQREVMPQVMYWPQYMADWIGMMGRLRLREIFFNPTKNKEYCRVKSARM